MVRGIDATAVSAFGERRADTPVCPVCSGCCGCCADGVVAQEVKTRRERTAKRRCMSVLTARKKPPRFPAGAGVDFVGYIVTAASGGSRRGGCAGGLLRWCCHRSDRTFRG